MLKEIIISIVIVISIFIGNLTTQNYTKNTVKEITGEMDNVKTQIEKIESNKIDEEASNKLKEGLETVKDKWKKKHNRLAYYIEHDEIEKLENNIVGLETNINTKDYDQAMVNLEESKFILKHIQDKYAFTLQNIF